MRTATSYLRNIIRLVPMHSCIGCFSRSYCKSAMDVTAWEIDKRKARDFASTSKNFRIRSFVDWCRVVPVVLRAWHVSFELSGLTQTEDDDFAVVVYDAFSCKRVEVRSTNRDRCLEFFNVAA